MQVLYWGRALRTKETLPDFLKWRRVIRHPLVFRRLTVSQWTPGNGASQGGSRQVCHEWEILIPIHLAFMFLFLFLLYYK